MPSTSRTARAARAVSTALAPTVARSSETTTQRPDGSLTTEDLRRALGDPILDPGLLDRALTHRSYAYENGGIPTNERLEFLGDSVLGVVVTETLYTTHPDLSEGRLAKLRAAVVNARALAGVARDLDDETSRLEDDMLDLEPLLRDAVVLALPFTPLCEDDCPGLCIECGARLADDPDHQHDAEVDPRWAALRGLTQEQDDTGRDRGPTKE